MGAAFLRPLFRWASADDSRDSSSAVQHGSIAQKPPANAACHWHCSACIKGQHSRPIYSVDWLPFGTPSSTSSIAAACGDNHVRVFQLKCERNWTCVSDVEAHFGDANC